MVRSPAPVAQAPVARPAAARAWLARPAFAVAGLSGLGLALRLYRLDARSLWLDETATAGAAGLPSVDAVLAYAHQWIDAAPLIYLVTWLLNGLGGGESGVRLPFVLAGACYVPALYALGAALYRPRMGLIAAGLGAILPFPIWYSQEARYYAFLLPLTALQMTLAFRAARDSGRRTWAALAVVTILNLYTDFLAVAPTGSAVIFLLLALGTGAIGRLGRRAAAPGAGRRLAGQALGLGVVAALVWLAYQPLAPWLADFLTRDQGGFARLPAPPAAAGPAALDLLGQLDFQGLLLLLLAIGIGVAAAWARRGCGPAGALLLLWLGLPLGAFVIRGDPGILAAPPRYFSVLHPALLLLAALGGEGAARLAAGAVRRLLRLGAARATAAAYTALVLLLLAQDAPALAQSYAQPKQDYRGMARAIIAGSPPGSVVFALGSPRLFFFPGPLTYYLALDHAAIPVLDSRTLDYPLALRIVGGSGAVWGAVQAALTPTQQQRADTLGLAVTSLTDLTLLRLAAPGAPTQAQAAALLRWEAPDDPSAAPGLALLDAARPAAPPGPNLLPPPSASVVLRGQASPHGTEPRDRWALLAGTARAPGGPGFLLHPGGEVNVTLATARAVPGRAYTLLFRVRNGALAGEQRVYVTAEGADRRPLATFPTGGGYLCPRAPDWAPGGFAFVVPADTQLLTVWLRARGTGTAEFTDVALRAAP